jgi:hypothetical protein
MESKPKPLASIKVLGSAEAPGSWTGKATGLTEPERYELLALLQIYQLGQLRKSEAIAEAVERGLLEPLAE